MKLSQAATQLLLVRPLPACCRLQTSPAAALLLLLQLGAAAVAVCCCGS
jgi:hypothetical protein